MIQDIRRVNPKLDRFALRDSKCLAEICVKADDAEALYRGQIRDSPASPEQGSRAGTESFGHRSTSRLLAFPALTSRATARRLQSTGAVPAPQL